MSAGPGPEQRALNASPSTIVWIRDHETILVHGALLLNMKREQKITNEKRLDPRLCSVHTTPEEFEKGCFTLKTHQMFSVHTTPDKVKNVTITGHHGFAFEETPVREIACLS